MDLRNFFSILSRRKWIIILTSLITLIFVALYIFLSQPVYEASTTLRVASSSVATGDYNQFLYADRLLNTYAEIASSMAVRDELMKRLSLKEPPDLTVRVLPDTELIKITATSNSAVMASNIATTLGNLLIEQSQSLYLGGHLPAQTVINEQLNQIQTELQQAQKDYAKLLASPQKDPEALTTAKQLVDAKQATYFNLLNQYDQDRVKMAVSSNVVSVMDAPTIPTQPIRPQKALDLLLGLIVGLIGGLGLALIKENLDPRLYSTGQIEAATGLSSIAEIPKMGKGEKFKAFIGNPPPDDSFRSLRINLMNDHHGAPVKSVLITSANPGEGKSTVLINLAYAIAQSGKSVLILDSNLRSPALHSMLDCSNDLGLTNLLKQNSAPESIIMSSPVPGICVIPSGPEDRYPAKLLDSEGMKSLIHDLSSRFDIVLLDSPALLSDIDAEVIAPFVDAVLLVVNKERASRDELLSALKNLRNIQTNNLAMVVNYAKRSEKTGSNN